MAHDNALQSRVLEEHAQHALLQDAAHETRLYPNHSRDHVVRQGRHLIARYLYTDRASSRNLIGQPTVPLWMKLHNNKPLAILRHTADEPSFAPLLEVLLIRNHRSLRQGHQELKMAHSVCCHGSVRADPHDTYSTEYRRKCPRWCCDGDDSSSVVVVGPRAQ